MIVQIWFEFGEQRPPDGNGPFLMVKFRHRVETLTLGLLVLSERGLIQEIR